MAGMIPGGAGGAMGGVMGVATLIRILSATTGLGNVTLAHLAGSILGGGSGRGRGTGGAGSGMSAGRGRVVQMCDQGSLAESLLTAMKELKKTAGPELIRQAVLSMQSRTPAAAAGRGAGKGDSAGAGSGTGRTAGTGRRAGAGKDAGAGSGTGTGKSRGAGHGRGGAAAKGTGRGAGAGKGPAAGRDPAGKGSGKGRGRKTRKAEQAPDTQVQAQDVLTRDMQAQDVQVPEVQVQDVQVQAQQPAPDAEHRSIPEASPDVTDAVVVEETPAPAALDDAAQTPEEQARAQEQEPAQGQAQEQTLTQDQAQAREAAAREEERALASLAESIVSFLDGRVRVRHPGLASEEAARALVTLLKAAGITAAFSPRGSSVLLTYDATALDRAGFLLRALPLARYLYNCDRALKKMA